MSDDPTSLTSVEKILAWMNANDVPADQLDLVQQDEFSFDLLLPWHERWLAFAVS